MRERIRFLLIYYLFWVVFFIMARIIFLSYHVEDSKNLTLELVFGVFRNGIIMDMSMAGYYSILPFLWVTFSNFINKSVFQNSIFSYTFILLSVTVLVVVVDLEVYNTWNFRLDSTPLKFLSSPKEAFISVKSSPILRLILSFIILMVVASIFVYRIVANKIYDWKHIKNLPFIVYGLLLTAALIIPIRGGFGKERLKQHHVYFSSNNFANVSSLNAPWNFVSSLLKRASAKENTYSYLPKEQLDKLMNKLFAKSEKTQKVIADQNNTNVIVILVENLTSKVLDKTHNGLSITPQLNSLKNESIYFENFYSAADRSDKTVLSVLSGYPSQPKEALVEYSQKIDKLPILSKDFNDLGYSTQFYYGGDANFLSLKQYLFAGNFEKILEKADFETDSDAVSLGIPDSDVYNKFIVDHHSSKQRPFFSTILTLSSHEPFEIPGQGIYSKPANTTEQFYNALNYADASLGKFLEQAKKQPWWNNTLVVILGNHGNKLPDTKDKVDNFKIPMIWTGGVVHEHMKISNTYSQVDLANTLLGQLNHTNSNYKWSKNIFDNATKPWAFFVFNDGFGYVNNQNKIMFDNVGKIVINDPKLAKSKEAEAGKALQQRTYQDFLDL